MKKLQSKWKYKPLIIATFIMIIQLFLPPLSIHVNAQGENDQEKDENGVILVDETNTYKNTEFYKEHLFGIAGGFHLVGLDTVEKKAHIHGNILANYFNNGGNFGTEELTEVSYLKYIKGGGTLNNTTAHDSVLVVGKDTEIGSVDNGNYWSVNENKVDNPSKTNSPNSLWQDTEIEFIDFDEVKQEVKTLSEKLSKLENNATDVSNEDQNNQAIIVEKSDEFSVYNVKKDDFNFTRSIHIKGFDKENPSTLIINVDMKDKNELSIPNSVASYTDGTKVSTGEVTVWSNANVVWNIYDSSENDNVYRGTIKNTGAVTGSIIAPGATINLNSNINGTAIGEKIVVNAESHRDDYVKTNQTYLTDPED
ncbi:collagen-binding domain-containing protein, partial [Halolactibacillus halophilus]